MDCAGRKPPATRTIAPLIKMVQAMRRDNRGPFSKRAHGFTHFRLTPEKATVDIVDLDGKVLHQFEKSPGGAVRVTVNTPSDKSTLHQLKSLLGAGEDDD